MRYLKFLLLAVLLAMPHRALAQEADIVRFARSLGVTEVRGGLFLHDIEQEFGFPFAIRGSSVDFSKWQNVNAEILFDLPDAEMIRWLGSPRISLGGTLNFSGAESYARLAAVWKVPIFDTGLFIEPAVGGVVHDGNLLGKGPGVRRLGCRFLYYYGANIGYQIDEHLSALFSFDHASHYGVCDWTANDGINRVGVRLGWTLD